MPEAERFCLGGYWLDREPKSPHWLRCWYDPRTRKVRRKSLATRDLEEAKVRLAAFVLDDPAKPADDPDAVLLLVCLKHYWQTWSDLRPRPENARRPGELLLDFLGDDAVVGDLTKARQEAFMRWLVQKHEHAVATISRHLSVINAALRRAMETHEFQDDAGRLVKRRLLTDRPKIHYQTKTIAQVVGLPEPEPREGRPSLAQLGRFIDQIKSEALFRYTLLALNTWARPEAVCDLDPARQFDAEMNRLNLNPPGRLQTKKYRPIIPVTDCLAGWLAVWPQEGRLVANARTLKQAAPEAAPGFAYRPVDSVRRGFEETRQRAKVQAITRYSLRHLLASRASNDPSVPDKEVDIWLGHVRPGSRSGRWYRHYEPDYLLRAKQFTDAFMVELQKHCKRSLFAPADPADYRPLIYQKGKRKP